MTKREYQKSRFREWLQNFISIYCEVNKPTRQSVSAWTSEIVMPADVLRHLKSLAVVTTVNDRSFFAYRTSKEGEVIMIPIFSSKDYHTITLR